MIRSYICIDIQSIELMISSGLTHRVIGLNFSNTFSANPSYGISQRERFAIANSLIELWTKLITRNLDY